MIVPAGVSIWKIIPAARAARPTIVAAIRIQREVKWRDTAGARLLVGVADLLGFSATTTFGIAEGAMVGSYVAVPLTNGARSCANSWADCGRSAGFLAINR